MLILVIASLSGPQSRFPTLVPRGGADLPEQPDKHGFADLRDAHAERLGAFMEQFDAALQRARTTCKSGLVASLFGARDPTNIERRRDRRAMIEAFSLLTELYADSRAFASEEAWPAYVAATVRMHCCLHLLLMQDEASNGGLHLSFVAPETMKSFQALREACQRKPQGTVATVVGELRSAMRPLAADVLELVHVMLLSPLGATIGQQGDGEQLEHLAQQLEGALRQLEQLHHERQQQERAYAERCAMTDEQLTALAERAHDAEARLASAHAERKSDAEDAARASASAVDVARAAAATEARLEEELAACHATEAQLRREHDVARQELEQQRAAAATLQQNVAHLAASLSQLEGSYAQLSTSHHSLEQYCARAAQYEQHAQQRAHAHAQLVREECGAVPVRAHRELQHELQLVLQQKALLEQQHAATLHLLNQRQAEAQSAAAHARALSQRLELAEASRPAVNAPDGGSPFTTSGSVTSGSLFSGFADKLRDKSRDLKELSRGLVADLSSAIHSSWQEGSNAEQQSPDGEAGA